MCSGPTREAGGVQVQKLPMYDHNAPAMSVLLFYCRQAYAPSPFPCCSIPRFVLFRIADGGAPRPRRQATAWLNDHPSNVVAVPPHARPQHPRLARYPPIPPRHAASLART